MIKLKFNVCSFYCPSENAKQQCKKYSISKSYDENRIFGDVLLEIHNKYKIDKKIKGEYFIPQLKELMWTQHFSYSLCYDIDISTEEYLKLKLCDLEKQFNISGKVIPLYINYTAIGGTVGNVKGVRIYFNLDERDRHHNPHVHCEYSGDTTRIEIKTLKVLDEPFKRSKMDIAIDYITNHREELLNYWEKVIIDGEPIKLNISI